MISRLRETRARSHEPVQLNLTPLIDVLFNLLIFVLASASIAAVAELPIELPGSTAAGEAVSEPVVVSIGADLSMAVGGVPVSFESLEDAVGRALEVARDQSVVLHADRTVPTGVLVDLYDAVSRAGGERISIAAEATR